jgi:hypothetical protein
MMGRLSLLLTLTFAAGMTISKPAQRMTIIDRNVKMSKDLAGTIFFADSTGPIEGAKVEDCQHNWESCGASTVSDSRGQFSFPAADRKRLHYLRITWPDANPLEVVVKITGKGKNIALTLPAGG